MNAFTFYNPVKIYFGKDAIENVRHELSAFGPNVLLAYGGGSIKRNGLYERVVTILKECGKNITELSGIMANPRTTKVEEGVSLVKENHIDLILAVGGGSVIDCSKAIATVSCMEDMTDYWERLFVKKEKTNRAVPLATIVTLPATGSEMNTDCVITNWEEQLKYSYSSIHQYPRFSILDPQYTFTMPREQIVYGSIDILSHIYEIYFSMPDENNVSDDVALALMKNVMKNLELALDNPLNETARGNLMWDATMALNGIIQVGKQEDWMAHKIEHALSAFYDIPHGAGLAIVHPMYLAYVCKGHYEKFAHYAVSVMGIDPTGKSNRELALEGLKATTAFFKKIGAPTTLREVGIPHSAIDVIADKTLCIKTGYGELTKEDVATILRQCY